jgi:hypothetical protein
MTTIQKIWRLRYKFFNLLATKCSECGFVSYPPKAACPKCGSRNIKEIKLPKKGKIISFTVIRVPIEGFKGSDPCILGIIDLGGARILAQLTDTEPEELKIGMKVEATIRKTAPTLDGVVPYVIKFKPSGRRAGIFTSIRQILGSKHVRSANKH